jgi:hypothetical protein
VRLVTEADDDLIISVAHDLVARTAPQELPLFRATSAAYLTDPERVLRAKPQKDEVLGFGLEGVVVFLTPAALEIAICSTLRTEASRTQANPHPCRRWTTSS